MQAGERVHWTETRKIGKGYRMTTRHGKVVEDCGAIVVVKYRGRELTKLREQLRREGERTKLTEFAVELATEIARKHEA